MIDIDHFKAYNDKHGHSVGDEAIKLVATTLRRHTRKPVLCCRYGGDEFCLILPGADAEAAALIAERVRAGVASALAEQRAITVSVGYASVADGQFATHDKLFDAADSALYAAKEAGRNRVAAFHDRRAHGLALRARPQSKEAQ